MESVSGAADTSGGGGKDWTALYSRALYAQCPYVLYQDEGYGGKKPSDCLFEGKRHFVGVPLCTAALCPCG